MRLRIWKKTEEQDLVSGCRRGEHKAQRSVYEQHAPQMLAVCLRYVHDRSEAESVMVNGFLKVFDKIGQYSGEGSFEGWIRRIMVNESLLYLRQNKHAHMMVEVEAASREVYTDDALQQLAAEELMALVHKLPEGYRTVFNLYAIEGYSHKEIAEQLDIAENTSKSQLSRARSQLQQLVA
ncbi:MAG: sigma-70 family RNA polymerase sigma factor, partial [Bacteroidetes bacterium]|nr:sigma-70 family RNA polymerase sigma factor [Bacteroidota bacterium]